MTSQEALDALSARGIPYREKAFLRYIRAGDIAVANLFLTAGMSPDAKPRGEPLIAVAARNGHGELCKLLMDSGADPIGLAGLKSNRSPKDGWDILVSLSGLFTFCSSLLIALVGLYFTTKYNERQLNLATAQAERDQDNKLYQNRMTEMETVEKMIPHLAADERSKQAALEAISALASPELASRIARVYGGEGSIVALTKIAASSSEPSPSAVAALTSLASSGSTSDSTAARNALAKVLGGREKGIVTLDMMRPNGALDFCQGFVVSRGDVIVTAGHCIRASNLSYKDVGIRTYDGTQIKVKSVTLDSQGLIAVLRTGQTNLPVLTLSRQPLAVGQTVLKFAYDIQDNRQLRVNLGRIVASGDLKFAVASGNVETAPGLVVDLPEQTHATGSSGGPFLDENGDVACMASQGMGDKTDQCLTAEAIRSKFSQLGLPL